MEGETGRDINRKEDDENESSDNDSRKKTKTRHEEGRVSESSETNWPRLKPENPFRDFSKLFTLKTLLTIAPKSPIY